MQSEFIDSKFYKIKKGAKKIGENCSDVKQSPQVIKIEKNL